MLALTWGCAGLDEGEERWLEPEWDTAATTEVDVVEVEVDSPCRLRMLDGINEIDTILEVDRTGPRTFEVTDGVGSEEPWLVHVEVSTSGIVETDAGVPRVTCQEILEEDSVAADEDEQLTFLVDEAFPCTTFDKGLIYFLVMEWFYFG